MKCDSHTMECDMTTKMNELELRIAYVSAWIVIILSEKREVT